jgi:hypothetical protein
MGSLLDQTGTSTTRGTGAFLLRDCFRLYPLPCGSEAIVKAMLFESLTMLVFQAMIAHSVHQYPRLYLALPQCKAGEVGSCELQAGKSNSIVVEHFVGVGSSFESETEKNQTSNYDSEIEANSRMKRIQYCPGNYVIPPLVQQQLQPAMPVLVKCTVTATNIELNMENLAGMLEDANGEKLVWELFETLMSEPHTKAGLANMEATELAGRILHHDVGSLIKSALECRATKPSFRFVRKRSGSRASFFASPKGRKR